MVVKALTHQRQKFNSRRYMPSKLVCFFSRCPPFFLLHARRVLCTKLPNGIISFQSVVIALDIQRLIIKCEDSKATGTEIGHQRL